MKRLSIVCLLLIATAVAAQQPVSRIKGRVTDERGAPIPNADVRVEAFYGYGAGTFAGQRTYAATTNAKGEWNVLGITSGVWLFEVYSDRYLPESVALPIRLLTTISSGQSGLMFTWQLVLKPPGAPDDNAWTPVIAAADAARRGKTDDARAMLTRVPDDANADYLAAAGRVALAARDRDMARTYFTRAIERDPSSYRAALGVASVVLLQRDFDLASRAFDAARSRTRDKDEQKFLTAAIGDLATILRR
jgi:tetratricopeptide (TPR) repeat protein